MSENSKAPEAVEITTQNYALMDGAAVVSRVFENPTAEFVADYNAKNVPRIYACPADVQVGWIRERGIFRSPSE